MGEHGDLSAREQNFAVTRESTIRKQLPSCLRTATTAKRMDQADSAPASVTGVNQLTLHSWWLIGANSTRRWFCTETKQRHTNRDNVIATSRSLTGIDPHPDRGQTARSSSAKEEKKRQKSERIPHLRKTGRWRTQRPDARAGGVGVQLNGQHM